MKQSFLMAAALTAILLSAGCGGKTTPAAGSLPDIDAVTGATGFAVKTATPDREAGRKVVAEFLKESKVYNFASVENNKPRVRPLGIFLEHDGKIWFHIGKHKAGFAQIQVNPNVEIVSVNDKGDWIRLSGKAVTVNNPELDEAVFNHSPGLRKMYNAETGHTLGHFYIADGTAEISRGNTVELYRF
jgi:uncharacterized pyridoxamine 5'-phosphate oxidase family protein